MQAIAEMERAMNDKNTLPRKVVVGTAMYAMYGNRNPYPGLEKRLDELGELIDAMAEQTASAYPNKGLDLVVLPEFAVNGGLPGRAEEVAFELDGPVLEKMGHKARQHQTYVVVPMYLVDNRTLGLYSNACVLLDRTGTLVGIYRKVHPVASKNATELEGGVQPGRDFPVFDCDFGKIGFQICFDIYFEDGWQALAQNGAEIVAWPTQTPQTARPSAFALKHKYYVVSSTWRNNASFFDPTGLIAAQIQEPRRVLVHQIDLSYVLLPWQSPLRNGALLAETHGDRVGFCYSEAEDGGIFWSNDPNMSIYQMVRDLGLEEVHDLVARNGVLIEAIRKRS